MYKFVWTAQTRTHIRKKKIDNESTEERERMIKAMKINEKKKIDESMKNMREILEKMTKKQGSDEKESR